ncbi:HAD hydrolase-like protein [bacterium]|nr:HAD hydrolase-like protein [bacterium]
MYKIFLFDIDGTLISSGGSGNKSLNIAFEKMFGIKAVMNLIKPAGMTDPVIVRALYKITLNKESVLRSEIDNVLDEYLKVLPDIIQNAERYRVLDGVYEVLGFLQNRSDSLLGLGTGNLEKGARIKLARGDLNKYFNFGGFSDDAEKREDILAAAKIKAEKILGSKVDDQDIFVVGDTQLDVRACKKNNFKMIAVASGSPSYEDLQKERPDYLINSLAEFHSLPIFN